MPTFELEEPAEGGERTWTPIPDDTIAEAELLAVEVKTKNFTDDNGDPVKKVEFAFQIKGGEFDGRRVWGETSTAFKAHPDCRLRNWAQELLGSELPAGYQFNTDDVIGNRCRIVIGVRSWTDKKTGEAKQRNEVRDVMRAKHAGLGAYDDAF